MKRVRRHSVPVVEPEEEVATGQLTDIFGRNRLDDLIGLPFGGNRTFDGGADADDDDFLWLLFGRRSELRRLGRLLRAGGAACPGKGGDQMFSRSTP